MGRSAAPLLYPRAATPPPPERTFCGHCARLVRRTPCGRAHPPWQTAAGTLVLARTPHTRPDGGPQAYGWGQSPRSGAGYTNEASSSLSRETPADTFKAISLQRLRRHARHRRLHHSTAARRVRWHDRQWGDVLVDHLWLLGLRFRPPWSVCIPPLLHDAGSGVRWATDVPTARRRSATGGPNSLRLAPDPRGDTCNGAR